MPRLDQHGEDLRPRPGRRGEPLQQVLAADQLHRHVHVAVVCVADIEDGDDVWVGEPRERTGFIEQSSFVERLVVLASHDLQRDVAIELSIACRIDHAHPPVPTGSRSWYRSGRGVRAALAAGVVTSVPTVSVGASVRFSPDFAFASFTPARHHTHDARRVSTCCVGVEVRRSRGRRHPRAAGRRARGARRCPAAGFQWVLLGPH